VIIIGSPLNIALTSRQPTSLNDVGYLEVIFNGEPVELGCRELQHVQGGFVLSIED